jgi:hypothetical protein
VCTWRGLLGTPATAIAASSMVPTAAKSIVRRFIAKTPWMVKQQWIGTSETASSNTADVRW